MIGASSSAQRFTVVAGVLVALLAAILIAAAWQRLQYGVDFTDESFYAALPYEFTLGNQPFLDEHALQQTAGLLAVPLVELHHTNEGLVLFLRRSWLVLAVLTGAVIAFSLARRLGLIAALTAGAIPVAYVPLSIPSLSYNTLGMLLLTIGLFAAVASLFRPRLASAATAIAVVALAGSSFAYPTIVPAALIACVALAISHFRAGNRRAIAALFAAGILSTAAVGAFVLRIGIRPIREALDFQNAFGMQAGAGLRASLSRVLQHGTVYPVSILLAIIVLAVLAGLLPRVWSSGAVGALALMLAFFERQDVGSTSYAVVCATIAFTVAAALRSRHSDEKLLLVIVAIPSVVAGVCTAWTSSNGLPNAAIGLLPALVVTVALLAEGVAVVGIVAFVALLHYGSWCAVYRDDPIAQLDRLVHDGPFAGLRTTAVKADYLRSMERDVGLVSRGARTILFYDNFPAGYLLSSLRPAAPTVWIPGAGDYPRFDRRWYVRFFAARTTPPDVVVELRSVPVTRQLSRIYADYATDPFRNAFWTAAGHCVGIERENYSIYDRCHARVIAALEAESLDGVARPGRTAGSNEWSVVSSGYSGGMAAIASSGGEVMALRRPLPAGSYLLDLTFYSYGKGENSFTATMGDVQREVSFACREGLHRVANIRFDVLTSASLSLRSDVIGQSALIIDRLIVRRLTGAEPALVTTCAQVGPQRFISDAQEAETLNGVQHSADYAAAGRVGWASFAAGGYSGNAAALTTATGARMSGRIRHFRPGRYTVVVKGYSYDPAKTNVIELTVGGESRRVTLGGSGSIAVSIKFRDVRSAEFSVRAETISQPALVVDALEFRPD